LRRRSGRVHQGGKPITSMTSALESPSCTFESSAVAAAAVVVQESRRRMQLPLLSSAGFNTAGDTGADTDSTSSSSSSSSDQSEAPSYRESGSIAQMTTDISKENSMEELPGVGYPIPVAGYVPPLPPFHGLEIPPPLVPHDFFNTFFDPTVAPPPINFLCAPQSTQAAAPPTPGNHPNGTFQIPAPPAFLAGTQNTDGNYFQAYFPSPDEMSPSAPEVSPEVDPAGIQGSILTPHHQVYLRSEFMPPGPFYPPANLVDDSTSLPPSCLNDDSFTNRCRENAFVPSIPKLQIGSFNVPTYEETGERFSKVLMQRIQEIGGKSESRSSFVFEPSAETLEDLSLGNSHSLSGRTGDLKPQQLFSSLSAATTVPLSRQVSQADLPSLSTSFDGTALPEGFNVAAQETIYKNMNSVPMVEPSPSSNNAFGTYLVDGLVADGSGLVGGLGPPRTGGSRSTPTALASSSSFSDYNWNEPFLHHDLPPQLLVQLNQWQLISSNRLLSTFELSIFRTTNCVNAHKCEFAKQPTKCWASHNFSSNDKPRWRRRNPFIFTYKHLLCPKIQALKDVMRSRRNPDSQQKICDKQALQQACFTCEDSLNCQFSHSLEEQMYHPFVYKTQVCTNQSPNNSCCRPFCPFLHHGEYVLNDNGQPKAICANSIKTWVDSKNNNTSAGSPAETLTIKASPYEELYETPKMMSELSHLASFDKVSNDLILNTPSLSLKKHGAESSTPAVDDAFDWKEPHRVEAIPVDLASRFAYVLFKDCRAPMNNFELSVFRTTRCPLKTCCENTKVPTRCWATHASDGSNRWLRRNPWVYAYKHLLCPHVRPKHGSKDGTDGKSSKWSSCQKGRQCGLAHSIEEQMYHPFVYKTSNCVNKDCERPFCPFLHPNETPHSLRPCLTVAPPGPTPSNGGGLTSSIRQPGSAYSGDSFFDRRDSLLANSPVTCGVTDYEDSNASAGDRIKQLQPGKSNHRHQHHRKQTRRE